MRTILAFAALAACGGDTGDSGTYSNTGTQPTGNGVGIPDVAGVSFVDGITNPYLPFPDGAVWEYDKGPEHVEVTATGETKAIMGVTATVVHDQATEDGAVTEDTDDYYAQDMDGNVWYVGEDTCVYENGACTDKEGSWTWGVDGALPGYAFPADPTVDGTPYHQEWYPGHAEDVGEVIDVGQSATVPAGSFDDCVVTHDTSTLETDVVETKYYCRGIGNVKTEESDGTEQLGSYSGIAVTP